MSTQIQSLVDDYNRIEGEQTERLRGILALLAEATGPRRLVVADQAITDFGPHSVEALLARLNRGISKVEGV